MGNEGSSNSLVIPPIPTDNKNAKHQFIYRYPFENHSDPMFWNEYDLSNLYFVNFQENFKMLINNHSPSSLHSTKDFFDLFYGCFEQLPNPIDVLDSVIQSTINENETIDDLSLLFEFHRKCSILRYNNLLIFKKFANEVDISKDFHDFRGNAFSCSFQKILSVISKMKKFILKQSISKSDFDEVQSVVNSLKVVVPPNELIPPSRKYFSNKIGHKETFFAPNLYPHCISSNGQHLFILSENNDLIIFPLLSNGALLSPPIVRKFTDFSVDESFSLASNNTHLIICSIKNIKRVYRISDLLSSTPISEIHFCDLRESAAFQDEGIFLISDGIILAEVGLFYPIKVFDFESKEKLYNKTLKSQILLNFREKISMTPIGVNGSFIGFLSKIGQMTYVFKVFSLITGELINEEHLNLTDSISAMTIDSINHCTYVVVPGINGTMEVRRYELCGSYNPLIFDFSSNFFKYKSKLKKKDSFKMLSSSFNLLLLQVIGARYIPRSILASNLNELQVIIDSLCFLTGDLSNEYKSKKFYLESVQFLSILLELNIKFFESNKNESEEKMPVLITNRILSLIPILPNNVGSYLFFLHFDTFFLANEINSISILKSLFESMKSPNLITFCLTQLEKSDSLARISFNTDNAISSLIPKNLISDLSIPNPLLSLLFVHQHVLISATNHFIKEQPYMLLKINKTGNSTIYSSSEIFNIEETSENNNTNNNEKLNNLENFTENNKSETSALDFFFEYSQLIINKFFSAISSDFLNDELEDSLIFSLFDNFMRNLSILSDSHRIAQQLTALLTTVIPKLTTISNRKDLSKKLKESINFAFLVFSKFAATLVKGGGETEFEQRFYWLIKENLKIKKSPLFNYLDSEEIDHFDDDRIAPFINDSKSPIMNKLYTLYRPQFNRNLTEDIKKLDRIALITICKHLKIIDELTLLNCKVDSFDNTKLSSQIISALNQMIRIRSYYRKLIQENNKSGASNVIKLSLILLRLKSKCKKANLLSEFILSNFLSSLVVELIKLQPTRIQTTLVGFAILGNMLQAKKSFSIFHDCVAKCLSNIDCFDGLAYIILSTDITEVQKEKITQFFMNLIQEYKATKNTRHISIIFRFFRDLEMLPGLQKIVFKESIPIIENNNIDQYKNDIINNTDNKDNYKNDLAVFSLAYMLLRNLKIEYIPDLQNPTNWLLLSGSLRSNNCSAELFNVITEKLFSELYISRIICRTLYNALNSNCIETEQVNSFFERSFKFISDSFTSLEKRKPSFDVIWLFRRIINEDSPRKKQLIKYMESSTNLLAVFEILGSKADSIYPFCNVTYRSGKIINNYISIPFRECLKCFPLPFNLASPHVCFERNEVSVCTLVELNNKSFPDFDFIFSFIDKKFPSDDLSIEQAYFQVLSHFSIYPEFCNYFNEQHIDKLFNKAKPFLMINDFVCKSIKDCASIQVIKKKKVDHFSVIKGENHQYSYLTPFIIKSTSFTIEIEEGYIGVMSDSFFPNCVRYELIHYPSGNHFPSLDFASTLKSPLNVCINLEKMKFTINSLEFNFPESKLNLFRFVISADKDKFKVNNFDKSSFSKNSHSKIFSTISNLPASNKLFKSGKINQLSKIPIKYKDIQSIDFSVNDLTIEDKNRSYFVSPPIPLHVLNSKAASKKLIRSLWNIQLDRLIGHFSLVTLMRIALCRPNSLSKYSSKLFSILSISFEHFKQEKFDNNQFCFDIDLPIWNQHSNSSSIYYEYESEMEGALNALTFLPGAVNSISERLMLLVSQSKVHLCSIVDHHVDFVFNSFDSDEFKIKNKNYYKNLIVSNSEFKINSEFPKFINESKTYSSEQSNDGNEKVANYFVVLKINGEDNSWCFNNVFELLISLKNFVFLAKTAEHRTLVKRILIDLYISESPFVRPFLLDFVDHIQENLISSPIDFTRRYFKKIVMLSSYLKKMDEVDVKKEQELKLIDAFKDFYSTEQKVLNNEIIRNVSYYFPEFFKDELTPPSKKVTKFNIPYVIIDTGALMFDNNSSDVKDEITLLKHINKKYSSLIGFPFWEVLPYYIRLLNISENKDGEDFVPPSVSEFSDNVFVVENTTHSQISVSIKIENELSDDSSVMQSTSPQFENTEYISGTKIKEIISLKGGKTYFTMMGYSGDWSVEIINENENEEKEYKKKKFIEVDIEKICQQFVNDMTKFAVQWSDEDTEILVNSIPKAIMDSKKFKAVSSYADSCVTLVSKYSSIVVKMRALFLHHFNYIRTNYINDYPKNIWDSLKNWVSNEEASKALLSSIICDESSFREITINRFIAKKLVSDGKGDSKNSIIGQLAQQFDRFDPAVFRGSKRPWKVIFSEEKAVDAGGPMKELMTEAAKSIFQPTSNLFVQMREFFIPFQEGPLKISEYRAVGQFIAIIVRTGYPQNLPFAPLVWKFISGGIITKEDLYFTDHNFEEMMITISNSDVPVKWEVPQWNGKVVPLPQHSQSTVANVSQLNMLVIECIQFRIRSILPMLREIKKGFNDNIGFESHPILSGTLLSYLAQGSDIITVEQLKSITVVDDFGKDEDGQYIQRFWKSVDKFSIEQRHLLLKFITTLTRLPISLQSQFEIKIDKMVTENPDKILPTSSTCFNKMHWPCYSTDEIAYQKLLYAVINCQTLDLA